MCLAIRLASSGRMHLRKRVSLNLHIFVITKRRQSALSLFRVSAIVCNCERNVPLPEETRLLDEASSSAASTRLRRMTCALRIIQRALSPPPAPGSVSKAASGCL